MGVSVEFASRYPKEREVLFPPGTHFRVLKTRKDGFEISIEVIATYNYDNFVKHSDDCRKPAIGGGIGIDLIYAIFKFLAPKTASL